jgi:serine/threonine-protein kinase
MAEQLHHPNLAQVYDAKSVEHQQAFLVLEYIEGITCERVIEARPLVPLRLAVELARQAAEAIAFLHSRSFVHRDIAPDNLMLRRERDGAPLVKLIDLGIAKPLTGSTLTSVGSFLGKLWYASPEQLEGGIGDHGAVGPSSDVYSLGLVMYELMTGAFPFAGSTQADAVQAPPVPGAAVVRDHRSRRSPAGELAAARAALLEKQPGRRPASARDVAVRLRGAMDELRPEAESVPAALVRLLGPPPAPERRITNRGRPGRRRRWSPRRRLRRDRPAPRPAGAGPDGATRTAAALPSHGAGAPGGERAGGGVAAGDAGAQPA